MEQSHLCWLLVENVYVDCVHFIKLRKLIHTNLPLKCFLICLLYPQKYAEQQKRDVDDMTLVIIVIMIHIYLFMFLSILSFIYTYWLTLYGYDVYETSFYHYYYYSDNSDFTKEYLKSFTMGSTWRTLLFFIIFIEICFSFF